MAIFPNNRRALLAFLHDVLMAALSVVVSLYLRLGGEIVDYKPPLTITYILSFTRDCGERISAHRPLSRHLALRLASRSLQHRPRRDPYGGGFPAGDVRTHPPRGAAAVDIADRLVRADRAVGRAASRLPAVQGPRPRPHFRARQASERAGAADQRQGRGRHLHPRDDARPARGLSRGRRPRRYALARRPGDLPRAGPRHDRRARGCRRAARSARQAPAKADHHRAEFSRRAGRERCSTAPTRWRYRWRVSRGSPIFAATSTIPNAPSSRSPSRICSAARRRCSTATGWRS